MAKLTKDKILSMISQEISNSMGYYGGELTEQRRQALKYYRGEKLGNEVEGQSQVVSQDMLEVVESIMPSMMRIFTQGESIVRFEPQQPEDVEYAEQATDYMNHIFMKDNDGYSILYTLFKDALISKNGFVKYYWKTSKEQKKESYEGLTEEEYQSLLADDEIEIIKVDEKLDGRDEPIYDVDCKRVKEIGRIKIENVAPENILITPTATSLEDCNFIAQRVYKTRSELTDMGYDRKIIDLLPPSDEEIYNTESVTRRSYDDVNGVNEYQSSDPSMTQVMIHECYLRIDTDGDGIAELRKIIVGGNAHNNYHILDNEEIEQIPFATVCANPMPHRFFGLSMFDMIGDLQEIKTTLMRQVLNNCYLQNNSRVIAVDGQVNIDDLLVSRAGGIVRVKNPNAVTPLQTQNFISEGLAMIDKIDQIKEQRSGVNKVQMGTDPDIINKSHTTATSSNVMMNASTQRIELIARNFSEGVKRMFRGLLTLVCTHQDKERIIRLRGKFIPMNPRQWVDRYDATVMVGLGTGSQDQRLDVLGRVLGVQEKLISMGGMGLVDTKKVYNTLEKYLENAGYKDAQQFFNDPEMSPPQPPKQKDNPALALAQQEMMRQQQKDQADLQLKARKQQFDEQLQSQKLNLEEQKLATKILSDVDNKNLEKEKLATKIIQQGIDNGI